MRALCLAILALAGGCKDDDDDSSRETQSARGDAPSWQPTPGSPCQLLEQQTRGWFEQFQACSRNEDCAIIELAAGCVGPFYCPVPVNAQVDRRLLEGQASERAAEYLEQCSCQQPNCLFAGDRTVCDPQRRVCVPRLSDY